MSRPQLTLYGQYERTALWIVISNLVYVVLNRVRPEWHSSVRVLLALNIANLIYLALARLGCHRLHAEELERWSNRPLPPLLVRYPWIDEWLLGGRTGLSFVVTASFTGFMAAAVYLPLAGRLELPRPQLLAVYALSLLTVVCSWLTAHLAYALHYSFLYYQDQARGLSFPDDEAPDLMDFVYFAFTVGATFATSDVEVRRKDVRRVVLKHTLFSFVFNTAILALALQFATTG